MILLLALMISVEARNEGCKVACSYELFDSGHYKSGKCICTTAFLYDDLVQKKYVKPYPKTETKDAESYFPEY